jgi:hypothetical protein
MSDQERAEAFNKLRTWGKRQDLINGVSFFILAVGGIIFIGIILLTI